MRELEDGMSEDEYGDWIAFDKDEPINSFEIQLAILSQMVSSFMGNKTEVGDFLLQRKPEETPVNNDNLEVALKGMFG